MRAKMCFPPREHREVPVPEGVGREAAAGKGFCAAMGALGGWLGASPVPPEPAQAACVAQQRPGGRRVFGCLSSWWWGWHPLSGPIPSGAEMQVSGVCLAVLQGKLKMSFQACWWVREHRSQVCLPA